MKTHLAGTGIARETRSLGIEDHTFVSERKLDKLKRKMHIGKRKSKFDSQSMASVSLSRRSSISSMASGLAFNSPSPNQMHRLNEHDPGADNLSQYSAHDYASPGKVSACTRSLIPPTTEGGLTRILEPGYDGSWDRKKPDTLHGSTAYQDIRVRLRKSIVCVQNDRPSVKQDVTLVLALPGS